MEFAGWAGYHPRVKTRVQTVIIAQNEADRIARAVRSALPLGPVTVLDGGSSDETIARARKAGAETLSHPWPGYAAQRRYALETVACEWMLFLDADEEITPELAAEIAACAFDADGYRIRRRGLFLGGWMRHGSWGRNRVLRLFRRARARVEDRLVHEEVSIDGVVADLSAPMLHYSQGDFAEVARKFELYVPLMAEDLARRRRSIGGVEIALRAASAFVKDYVLLAGFLDGWRGFVLAFWGMSSVVAKYAEARRLIEARAGGEKSRAIPPSNM